jgi:hypothetical protein
LRVRQSQDVFGHFLELLLFIIADIAELALGKTVSLRIHELRRYDGRVQGDSSRVQPDMSG